MNALERLRRAVKLEQPVMFDPYEAIDLWYEIVERDKQIEKANQKYDELLGETVKNAWESSFTMLKATLAGVIIGKKDEGVPADELRPLVALVDAAPLPQGDGP